MNANKWLVKKKKRGYKNLYILLVLVGPVK